MLTDPGSAAAETAPTGAAVSANGTARDRRSDRRPPTVERPADLTRTVASIVEELNPMFSGFLAAAAITECATRAVHDLLGSICLQALPEMAVRLATVRLQSQSTGQTEPTSEAG